MAVPTGTASMLDIQNEFGGSAPISLSEYYGAASGVPTSGTISINDFRGKSNIFTFTISSTQVDANLRSLAVAAGWNQSVAVVATIGSGVNINGSVAGNSTAALTIDGSWPGGVTLVNNGSIRGRGGTGGASRANGGAGGRALLVSVAVTINNQGTIAGGGGGGAGGNWIYVTRSCDMGETDAACRVYGGGGGGGQSNTSYTAPGGAGGGTAGTSFNCTVITGSSGGTGTSSAPGGGGTGASCVSCACTGSNGTAQSGGGGGSLGAAGGNTSYTGGAAGQAISGNSNITWTNTGTLLGTIV